MSVRSTLLIVAAAAVTASIVQTRPLSSAEPSEKSAAYFNQMALVLQHPRCLNCHPRGDQPTQGKDFHLHVMNVQRGPDDHGAVGNRCATCHQAENNPTSGVPGAPKWALAPRSMGWQGLSRHDLCLAIKDPVKNHGKSLDDLIHHDGEDKLVAWGWNPGAGREPVPGTQKEFGELTRKWVESGAGCPGE